MAALCVQAVVSNAPFFPQSLFVFFSSSGLFFSQVLPVSLCPLAFGPRFRGAA